MSANVRPKVFVVAARLPRWQGAALESTADAERFAADTWRTMGIVESPGARPLARRVFGAQAIVLSHGLALTKVLPHAGRLRVVVPAALDPATTHWQIGHAVADWLLRHEGLDEAGVLSIRSGLAAAIVLPREQIADYSDLSAEEIAHALTLPVAATLLREAEVTRVPTALVVRGRYTRVRGDDAGRLPRDAAALEYLAAHRAIGVVRTLVPEGVVLRLR